MWLPAIAMAVSLGVTLPSPAQAQTALPSSSTTVNLANYGGSKNFILSSTDTISVTSGHAVTDPFFGYYSTIHNDGTITTSGNNGRGLDLQGVPMVYNTGSISGTGVGGTGVFSSVGKLILNNSGTVAGTDQGVLLNFGTVNNNGLITGGIGVYAADYPGTLRIDNNGTITGTTGEGVKLVGNTGRTVINSGSIGGANGVALSFGGGDDLLILGPAYRFTGVVQGGGGHDSLELLAGVTADTSFSRISGGLTSFEALKIDSGATFSNAGSVDNFFALSGDGLFHNTGTLTASSSPYVGLNVASGSHLTITNDGLITGGSAFNVAVNLLSGTLTNTSTGRIQGLGANVFGFYIASGASLNNQGYIGGTYGGQGASGSAVTNSGTIHGSANGLLTLGSVTNEAGGVIAGVANTGLGVGGTGVHIINSGTITGGIYGVYAYTGNHATITNYGSIGSGSGVAVLLSGTSDTLQLGTGFAFTGSVVGHGDSTLQLLSGVDTTFHDFSGFANFQIDSGATWTNTGSFDNLGTVSGDGSLHNTGTLTASAHPYMALNVAAGGHLSITNDGLITGSSGGYPAAYLRSGTLTNGSAGRIEGYPSLFSVGLQVGSTASLNNQGYIGGGIGAYAVAGSTVTNSSTIYGSNTGLLAHGDVTNSAGGVITGGTQMGVQLYAGATLTNQGNIHALGSSFPSSGVNVAGDDAKVINTGTITGYYGVLVGADRVTITNYGSIGGIASNVPAIQLQGNNDVLQLGTGFAFTGHVFGNSVNSTLELLSGVDTSFRDFKYFNSLVIDGGATWTNTGSINNFTAVVSGYGSLHNTGTFTGAGYGLHVDTGATLAITNDGSILASTYGVRLGGGTLTNTNTGLIGANHIGVYVDSGATLVNQGSIYSVYHEGVKVASGGTFTNSGSVSGARNALYLNGGTATNLAGGHLVGNSGTSNGALLATGATLFNQGVIAGGSTGGSGVRINGTDIGLDNRGAISGIYGVSVDSSITAAITIANRGSIGSTAVNGYAVKFNSGNDLLQLGSGFAFTGTVDGGAGSNTLEILNGLDTDFFGVTNFQNVRIDNGATWTNAGTFNALGINVYSGGKLVNSGSLYNSSVGVSGSGGTVVNTGSIFSNSFGVMLQGGSVANQGSIFGTLYGVSIGSQPGTVTNDGEISGINAVAIASGGSVVNGSATNSSARIYGFGYGIAGGNVPVSVTNYGDILGMSSYGVMLHAGGTVLNKGQILSNSGIGIQSDAAVTITNEGGIFGAGVGVHLSGSGSSTVFNRGMITGYASGVGIGVQLDASTDAHIINYAGAAITSGMYGVLGAATAATVTNYGRITTAGFKGVSLNQGTLDNKAGGYIAGRVGAFFGGTAHISNAGNIYGSTDAGVALASGGTLTNSGYIHGGPKGVLAYGTNSITNDGTIFGGTTGVDLSGTSSAQTLVNRGTISAGLSGKSVVFGSGDDELDIAGNARFDGWIDGGSGVNTLNFVGNGTLTGRVPGTAAWFYHFNTPTITNGEDWTFDGRLAFIGGGLAVAGSLTNLGKIETPVVLQGTGALDNQGYIYGARVASGADATITNSGILIQASLTGLTFDGSGTLTNTATGQVYGATYGVSVAAGGYAKIVNDGLIFGNVAALDLQGTASISNTGHISGAGSGAGILGTGALTLDNSGTISGRYLGIDLHNASDPSTITNSGTIRADAPGGYAIKFGSGNNLLRIGAGAVFSGGVDGGTASALEFLTGANYSGRPFSNFQTAQIDTGATWTNAGSFTGSLDLEGTGKLVNQGSLNTVGTGAGANATITNSGTISSGGAYGVVLSGSDTLTNTSSGVISAAGGVAGLSVRGPAVVSNDGYIGSAAGAGIQGVNALTLTNNGSIYGGGAYALSLQGGGTVTNTNTGLIAGGNYGVAVYGTSAPHIDNAGTITGSVAGVYVKGTLSTISTATVSNTGYIGSTTGAAILGAGVLDLTNSGTVKSTTLGIDLYNATVGSTITNTGTIAATTPGGYAIKFGSGDDLLRLGNGAYFQGYVDGGGGTNTIGFVDTTGTLSGNVYFRNFRAVTITNGQDWTFAPGNVYFRMDLGNGGTLTNRSGSHLQIYGTLTNSGSFINNGTLVSYGPLINDGAGQFTNNRKLYNYGGIDNAGLFTNTDRIANEDTITNSGTFINDGTVRGGCGCGSLFTSSGSLQNTTNGYIYGGVTLTGTQATLTNAGAIIGHPGNPTAVYGAAGSSVHIDNTGAIGSYPNVPGGFGIDLLGDGVIANSNAGHGIYGYESAIRIAGTGTIANDGSIVGYNGPAIILGAGTITNGGTANAAASIFSAHSDGIDLQGDVVITNFGTVISYAAHNVGVILDTGAKVINAATGSISGYYGVQAYGGTNTILNSGTIQGSNATFGVGILTKGTLSNTSIVNYAGGLITGATGVTGDNLLTGNPGRLVTITNYGTIRGIASTGAGVMVEGAVENKAGGLIEGAAIGAGLIGDNSSLINRGTIKGTDAIGVFMVYGVNQRLSNLGSASRIEGYGAGAIITGYNGTVTNEGTIISTAPAGGSPTVGISFSDSNTLINSGFISGDDTGVIATGGTLKITNSGTIQAATGTGIDLAATIGNNMITNTGAVIGNNGTAIAFGNYDDLLQVGAGASFTGTVDGGGGTNTLHFIAGANSSLSDFTNFQAVAVESGAAWSSTGTLVIQTLGNDGTVANAGTLTAYLFTNGGTFTNSGAFTGETELTDGAVLINQASGTITGAVTGSGTGVVITNTGVMTTTNGSAIYLTGSGAVTNGGTIQGDSYSVGVYLHTGTVTNSAGGTIIGGFAGIQGGEAQVNVTNAGTVIGYQFGVLLNGGSLTNSGGIAGGLAGVASYDSAVVTNQGTISGILAGALLFGTSSSLNNTGVITGQYGVILYGNGAVTNAGTIAAGPGGVALAVAFGNGSLTNTGTVQGAVIFAYGYSSSVTNQGLITSDSAQGTLRMGGGGTLTNSGQIIATGASAEAVALGAAGMVTNSGTIQATHIYGTGLALRDGAGVVINTGLISGGQYGVTSYNATLVISNRGTITGTNGYGAGVNLSSGGSVTNSGLISGGRVGISVYGAAGVVANQGKITGYTGVAFTGNFADTLTNSGTIIGTGGTAVNLGDGDDLVVIAPGAVFTGLVDGGAGRNVMEFAGGNAIPDFSQFPHFSEAKLDAGTSWTFSGTNTLPTGLALTSAGTIINTGTLNGSLFTNNGGSFANTGVIHGGDYGVVNAGGVLTNSGTIIGGLDGVSLSGGTLNNTGLVQGGRYGLKVTGAGTVVNNGTIIDDAIAGVSLGSNANLTNNAGATLSGVTGALFTGTNASLTNNGTITGTGGVAVQFGAGVNTLTLGSTSVLNGRLDGGGGSGRIVLTGTGALRTAITNFGAGSSLTVANGASWSINSMAIGQVVNSGTLGLGATPSTTAITGNFAQTSSGVLTAVLDNSGASSTLNVSGSAALDGTLKITMPTVIGAPVRYTIVSATGGVTGAFATLVPDNSALLGSALSYDANDAYVTVFQRKLTAPAGVVETPNQLALAAAFDAAVPSDPMGFGTAVGVFNQLPAAGFVNALNQMSGEPLADVSTAALSAGRQFLGAIHHHARVEQNPEGTWSLWGQAFLQTGHLDGDGNAHRMTQGLTGGVVGADYQLLSTMRLGGVIGFGHGRFNVTDGLGGGDADYTEIAFTTSYAQGPLQIDMAAGGVFGSGSTSRTIQQGTTLNRAVARQGSSQFAGSLEAGYRISLTEDVDLTPFARLQTGRITRGGFSETGGGIFNLTTTDQSDASTQTVLGARFDTPITLGVTPVKLDARLGWSHELDDVTRLTGLSLAGNRFTIAGASLMGDAADIGLGLSTPVFDNGTASLGYDGSYAGNGESHAVNVGLRFTW